MTTYTYRCAACGYEHTRPGAVGVSPAAIVTCPDCLRFEARRIWAVPEINVVGGTGGGKRPRKEKR